MRSRTSWASCRKASVPAIAKALNLSRAEVHGVITFYHDFRREPPGRHVVQICRAESCQSMQSDALCNHAKASLKTGFGETSADGEVTLAGRLLPRQLRAVAGHDGRRQACMAASMPERFDADHGTRPLKESAQ